MALRTERPTDVIFIEPTSTPLSEEGQKAAEKLFFVAEKLLAPDAEFLFGSWSIVDAELALMLQRLIQNGDTVPERLKNYALQQWQRPSVQKSLALRHN